jgi:hypothetical protein
MSRVGLQVGTARLLARRRRRVLVPISSGDEKRAGAQGEEGLDRLVGCFEVILRVTKAARSPPLDGTLRDTSGLL